MLPLKLSEPGPLRTYLGELHGVNPHLAKETEDAVRAMLRTREGAIFLELLEKSVMSAPTAILADQRALMARNAQGFIAADLRRMLSDETEKLLERKDQVAGARSAAVRRRPGRNPQ